MLARGDMPGRSKGDTFAGKRILVIGGTGFLGSALVRRLISGRHGEPARVVVFSRDEAKQHDMRLQLDRSSASSPMSGPSGEGKALQFVIGDIRDVSSVQRALRHVDIVFNTAALKQVPNCEYFPAEAVSTNVHGALNIVQAIAVGGLPVEAVIGISTDKACHPVSVMGMTKALQERILVSANLECPDTRIVCARYGNVLGSRGSVIPLFHDQIRAGGPVTITAGGMTRYFLSVEQAVDTVIDTYRIARPGEIVVPRVPALDILTLARCLIGERDIPIEEICARPGEKLHETLISEDEIGRTEARDTYYVVRPALPELKAPGEAGEPIGSAYRSNAKLLSRDEAVDLLKACRLLP